MRFRLCKEYGVTGDIFGKRVHKMAFCIHVGVLSQTTYKLVFIVTVVPG